VLPVLATMDRGEVSRRSGLHRRTIVRYLYKGMRAHRKHEAMLTQIAVEYASTNLSEWGIPVPNDQNATLHHFSAVLTIRRSGSGTCGRTLGGRQRKWSGATCRKRGPGGPP
jgi:hypothetical protein